MDDPQTLILEPGSEWRFELEADENISVRVSAHSALLTPTNHILTPQVQSPDPVYINGEELPPVTWYPLFRYTKGAIYAPSEARLEGGCLEGVTNGSFEYAGVAVYF